MEKLGCAWLEEPLFRYNYDELARLSREVDIPPTVSLTEVENLARAADPDRVEGAITSLQHALTRMVEDLAASGHGRKPRRRDRR